MLVVYSDPDGCSFQVIGLANEMESVIEYALSKGHQNLHYIRDNEDAIVEFMDTWDVYVDLPEGSHVDSVIFVAEDVEHVTNVFVLVSYPILGVDPNK